MLVSVPGDWRWISFPQLIFPAPAETAVPPADTYGANRKHTGKLSHATYTLSRTEALFHPCASDGHAVGGGCLRAARRLRRRLWRGWWRRRDGLGLRRRRLRRRQ